MYPNIENFWRQIAPLTDKNDMRRDKLNIQDRVLRRFAVALSIAMSLHLALYFLLSFQSTDPKHNEAISAKRLAFQLIQIPHRKDRTISRSHKKKKAEHADIIRYKTQQSYQKLQQNLPRPSKKVTNKNNNIDKHPRSSLRALQFQLKPPERLTLWPLRPQKAQQKSKPDNSSIMHPGLPKNLRPHFVSPQLEESQNSGREIKLFANIRGEDILRSADNSDHVLQDLKPQPSGGYSYQGKQIRAEIFPDGSVLLFDPPHVRAKLMGLPVERLPLIFSDPRALFRQMLKEQKKVMQTHMRPGGLPLNDDAKKVATALALIAQGVNVSVTFDLTESAMRLVGEDPYRRAKQCFLQETSALRTELAQKAQQKNEKPALQGLQNRLCEIWANPKKTEAQKRQQIFAIWDDCADTDLGHKARALIIAFIRQALPKSSKSAYKGDELRNINRDRSDKEKFRPYS